MGGAGGPFNSARPRAGAGKQAGQCRVVQRGSGARLRAAAVGAGPASPHEAAHLVVGQGVAPGAPVGVVVQLEDTCAPGRGRGQGRERRVSAAQPPAQQRITWARAASLRHTQPHMHGAHSASGVARTAAADHALLGPEAAQVLGVQPLLQGRGRAGRGVRQSRQARQARGAGAPRQVAIRVPRCQRCAPCTPPPRVAARPGAARRVCRLPAPGHTPAARARRCPGASARCRGRTPARCGGGWQGKAAAASGGVGSSRRPSRATRHRPSAGPWAVPTAHGEHACSCGIPHLNAPQCAAPARRP